MLHIFPSVDLTGCSLRCASAGWCWNRYQRCGVMVVNKSISEQERGKSCDASYLRLPSAAIYCPFPQYIPACPFYGHHTCQQSSIFANLDLLTAKSPNQVNRICLYKIAWKPSLRDRLYLGIGWIWLLWILHYGGRQSRWKYPIIGTFIDLVG